jgi:hypothetical protein
MAGLALLHDPPGVASPSVVADPTHTLAVPVIATGVAFIVIGYIAIQPAGPKSVIVAGPADTPVATPVVEFIVAIAALLLLQAPTVATPETVAESVIVDPEQSVVGPEITGTGLTVNDGALITRQPVGNV